MKMILPSPQGRILNKRPRCLFDVPAFIWVQRLFETEPYWFSSKIIFGNLEKGLWTTAVLQLQFISFITAKGSSRNVYFTLY